MAVPVACVHLKVAHAALPALLPTPPEWKTLPLLPTPCVAAVLPKPLANKPSRADSDERWDAHMTKPASAAGSSASSSPRSISAESVSSCAGRGSSRKIATSPPRPGRSDSAERWDAHKKKAAIPASPSGTSSVERWDVHKKHRCPPQAAPLDGDGGSSGSNDIDTEEEEEEILWKPRAMYAGPDFVGAAPEPIMLPMPTAFLVPVA